MLAYTRKGGKKNVIQFLFPFFFPSRLFQERNKHLPRHLQKLESDRRAPHRSICIRHHQAPSLSLSLSLSYALTKTWPPARPAVFFFLSLSSLLSLLSFSRSRSLAKFRFGNLSKNWNLLTKKPPQRFQEKTKKKREIIENSRLFRVSRLFR